jgi:chromosome partitioning protein
MSHIFVMTNHKGGVGKSTTATNVAFGLVQMLKQAGAARHNVLLIDTDSQSHATLMTTGRKDFGRDDSLYTVITAERKNAVATLMNCVVPSTWDESLHVLPASLLLESAERELIGMSGAPYRLSEPLKTVASQYGAVVIDTRPSFSLLTEMALIAATDAVVPVEPRYLETMGLLAVVNKIDDVKEGWQRPNLNVSHILVTKFDGRVKGHLQTVEKIKAHPVLGPLVTGMIPTNEAIAYSHHYHQSIFEYDPHCSASRAYALFVAQLIKPILKEGV